MPIYEYRCSKCGTVFEEIVASSTHATVACPSCSSNKTEKLISLIGGIGKGKGTSSDFACGAGAQCPGATSCGAGACCPNMN